MEIVKGRPLNVKERLKKEVRVYDLLDELDIEYWRIDHEVAQTMEDCEEVDRILDAVICKNLFLCNRQKTKVCTDPECTLVFCSGGIYGEISGYYPWFCQCNGADE